MNNSYLNFWQHHKRRNLWQHPAWAAFQKAAGRKTWLLETSGATALVVKHDLPKGLSWLEVPRGPLWRSKKGLEEILEKIKKLGKKEKSIFVRLSPYQKLGIGNWDLVIAKQDHHPTTSLTLDITQDEDDILAQMKPKGRYNIRLARKRGVAVDSDHEVDDFYHLLKTTGNRDGFGIHPKSYYQNMLDAMPDNAQLLLAEYEGKVIAGGIFVYLDEWGIYYYGASDNQYRNVMAPYLIQWQAIEEAKERGCKYYDFLGIAPENAPSERMFIRAGKDHPWAGVTQFKKKFGGQVVNHPPAQEMVLRPLLHKVYKMYKMLNK